MEGLSHQLKYVKTTEYIARLIVTETLPPIEHMRSEDEKKYGTPLDIE